VSAAKDKSTKIVRPRPIRPSGPPNDRRTQREAASAASLDLIRILGRSLDDLEATRIRTSNRIGTYLRLNGLGSNPGKDGDIDLFALTALQANLDATEKELVRGLEGAWRQHPLARWSRSLMGVGDKTVARLIAEIGDPLVRPVGHVEDEEKPTRRFVVDSWEPRSFAQLCAYVGHGDPKRKKRAPRRGKDGHVEKMSPESALQLGNPVAKKRTWLIASTAIKSRCPACTAAAKARNGDNDASAYVVKRVRGCTCRQTHPLRYAYDTARARYADRVHDEGANVGEPWTAGHQHAAALRFVGKTFLRMLYDAAQDARPGVSRPSGPMVRRRAKGGEASASPSTNSKRARR
jgi:hypothetical protein